MTSVSVDLGEFTEANREELEKLASIAEAHAGGADDSSSRAFATQALAIQTVLKVMFRVSARAARRTESMEDTVKIWENMLGACDATVQKLKALADLNPRWASADLYDVALDLRNAAARRVELHIG